VANPYDAFQRITLEEMSRVLDLIEHPPASGILRDILATYSGPKDFAAVREEIKFYECSQDQEELSQMLHLIRGKRSLLEVGSRFGGTLRRMAEVLAPKSLVVSVDFPMRDGAPHAFNPVGSLKQNCQRIADMGHHVELIMFDSHSPQVIQSVQELGPFDFGFIDADHSYEAVTEDWINYGPMCKVVGFHDIYGNETGVQRFWSEVKPGHRWREIINYEGIHKLGIGLIFNDDMAWKESLVHRA